MFQDRKDAGKQLGNALQHYEGCDGLVLGIPRGGAEVAYYAAASLRLPVSLVMVRKLPFPDNPESGYGAIAEDGSVYEHPSARIIDPQTDRRIRLKQINEIQRRIQVLRAGQPLPPIAGKTVIVVDDGIAMGSTMMAAVRLCHHRQAATVVAAAPVGSPSVVRTLGNEADRVVVLEQPTDFHAVADAYGVWYDVPDSEVIQMLQFPANGQADTP